MNSGGGSKETSLSLPPHSFPANHHNFDDEAHDDDVDDDEDGDAGDDDDYENDNDDDNDDAHENDNDDDNDVDEFQCIAMLDMGWRPDKEIPSWIVGYRLHIEDDDGNDDEYDDDDGYDDDDADDDDDDDRYDEDYDGDGDDVPPDNMEGVVGVKRAVGCALKMGFLQN